MKTENNSIAKKIMVIRHAEKPPNPVAVPFGVDIDGNQDPESLIVRGWQRAGALTPFFDPFKGAYQNQEIALPQYLFASKVSHHHGKSERPEETITPLAQRINLSINTDFHKEDYKNMLAAAFLLSGVVLIAWEHQDIPAIANIINGNSHTSPQNWPDNRFDIVWVFDLIPTLGYSFHQVPQNLLAGDKNTPIT